MNNQDKIEIENLLKIIRRAKFDDFTGLEAMALTRAYHWLQSKLHEPKQEIAAPLPEKLEQKENGKPRRFKRDK